MFLRNVYRRSLVRPRLLPRKASLLRSRKRPARTPPSTFLFLPIHLSNSPGTMAIPLPGAPGSRRSPRLPTEIGRLVTPSVRSFAGAPSRRKAGRRAVVEALYGRPLHLVNSKCPQSSPQVRVVEGCCLAPPRTRPEGSAPHSRHIPPALFASGKGLWSRSESSETSARSRRRVARRRATGRRRGVDRKPWG